MLGLYVSLRIGLPRPFWVLGTVYLVSQPLAGATVSRGLFRFLGTVGGAVATVLLVPTFANEPWILSAALALWMGFCLYLGVLDRTPRSYAFLLAGYTTSLIGFPSVAAPGEIFTVASTRVQEISIGILAATLVHSLILPRSVSRRVQARVAAILADTERWTRDMLAGARDAVLVKDRARAAMDLLELHYLSIHLPFDTAHGVAQVQILRALHDRLLTVLTLSSAIDDAQAELHASAEGVPANLRDVPDEAGGKVDWRSLLLKSLAADLAELEIAHRDCRLLEQQLTTADPQWMRHVPERLATNANGHVLHRDHWLAARSAVGATIGILLGCGFWIVTAWPDGATAVSIIGTACLLFGTAEAPAGNVMRYLIGSCIGVAIGLVYGFVIFPRTADFTGMAAVLAPTLLVAGSFLARPPFIMAALGVVLTFPIVAGLGATNASNFSSAINGSVALFVGTGMAMVSMMLFQTLNPNHSRNRLFQAMRRDVVRRVAGRVTDATRWTSRMLDRIGLLVPKLNGHEQAARILKSAFSDLRVGNVASELRLLEPTLTDQNARTCLVEFLDALTVYFRTRTAADARASIEHLLERLDRARATAVAGGAPEGERILVLLSNLHRDLVSRVNGLGA
ncbi:p-hydroxybenzoic acid efflux pump subunit AaeB [Pandoraea pulmonicola]|uniref:p-hydroxybenzoic acid efflux pump subunit AaeB n=2 Tax=Pandoraea pulmonicola TaxID=93221 RepID=A0AAJ5D288_PANPU|nr:FUSC family protein [Pandoraea pulmonicola]SUA92588.1 p-hydroxybenzoic acid efflux pump subunit AaeB [Pandoraea pulmonicola]